MRCVVTAGPTYEPLDSVRRLTNFSSGQLGTELANILTERGHEVTLLIGQQATWQANVVRAQSQTFDTTSDLRERLRELSAEQVDVVFHAAAVSDFSFGKIWVKEPGGELTEVRGGKISTRHGPLLAELVPTAKVIANLRAWFPKALLAGWKYEVDGGRPGVLALAARQITECLTDACVANGPAYGQGFALVRAGEPPLHLADQAALFVALAKLIER